MVKKEKFNDYVGNPINYVLPYFFLGKEQIAFLFFPSLHLHSFNANKNINNNILKIRFSQLLFHNLR